MRLPFLALALLMAAPGTGQPISAAAATQGETLPFADLADMATRAPVVAGVEIRRAVRLKGADAAAVARGQGRFYVEADVASLLRGAGGLAAKVRYLVDVPLDARGRAPKLKRMRVLLLAAPVEGRPGELRLAGQRAQIAWTPAAEARLRTLVTELVAADAPPRIAGVANAFHVPGSLPGESETQIFLTTDTADPASLSILRRPGEAPRWAVSLGDIVDEAAAVPARDTLLWYRLACGLPATLPEPATADLTPEEAAAARADYAVVLEGLGACRPTAAG
jgi:hypothetical protein